MEPNRIYDVAIALFRRNGIRTTDMSEVAVQLKISTYALSEMCGDKRTLVRRCIRREVEREVRWLEKVSADCRISPLKLIVKIYMHSIRYANSFTPTFFTELMQESYFRLLWAGYRMLLGKKYRKLLDRCRQQHLCTPDCDLSVLTDFLCRRFREISSGEAVPNRTAPDLSGFIVRSVLIGNCTLSGKRILQGNNEEHYELNAL